MNPNWQEVALSDIGRIVGGATPSTKNPAFYDGDIVWITPKDLSGYKERKISKGARNITQEGYDSCSTYLLPKGSILFSSRAPIGYVAMADCELCTNQGFKSIVPDKRKVDENFLFYALRFNASKIESMASGTTFKEVSGAVMKKVRIKCPKTLTDQKKIANILSRFDEKIEINNRIIKNIEDSMTCLFNEKCVKAQGKKSSLSKIAQFLNGLAMQKFPPKADEVAMPVLKIKELRQKCCDADSDLCSSSISKQYVVDDGDLIFSWSGSLLVDIWTGGKCGLNQHLFKVTSQHYPKWFVYLWIKFHIENFIAIAQAMATTMGHIKRNDLDKADVIITEDKEIEVLNKIFQPQLDLLIKLRLQNNAMTKIRDLLLPKLLSGEIDLSNFQDNEP